VLGAAVLAVVVTLAAAPPSRNASAHVGHANLIYDMIVSGAFSGQCQSYGPPGVCNVGTGRVFRVHVGQSTNHGIVFDAVQLAIEYSGVTPKGTPDLAPVDGCAARTDPAPQPAGKVIASCTIDPYGAGGILATFDFTCTSSPSTGHVITLRNGIGDEETYIQDYLGERHSAEDPDTITIDCIDAPTADMNLNAKGPNASCDVPPDPDECDVAVGAKFTLAVEADNPPVGGFAVYTTWIEWDGLLYNAVPISLPGPPYYSENVWPALAYDLRLPFDPGGFAGIVIHSGEGGDPGYAGNLVQLSMTCIDPGTFDVDLIAADPPLIPTGSLFTNLNSETVYVNSSDQLTINCIEGGPADTPTPAPATPTPASPPASPVSVGGVGSYPNVGGASASNGWLLLAGIASAAAIAGLGIAARRRVRR
jgi:hypothetical protein